jgi:hypothetical protein
MSIKLALNKVLDLSGISWRLGVQVVGDTFVFVNLTPSASVQLFTSKKKRILWVLQIVLQPYGFPEKNQTYLGPKKKLLENPL